MSSGATHDRIGLALVPVATFASGLAAQSLNDSSLLWVGAIAYLWERLLLGRKR